VSGATAEFLFGMVIGGGLIGLIAFVCLLYLISSPWERSHDATRD